LKAAVIGAAGRMGSWFTRYFAEKGFETNIYDKRSIEAREVADRCGVRWTCDAAEAVSEADVVLVSVPIDVTPKVVSEISRMVRQGAVIAEIASFKKSIIRYMRAAGRRGATPLSIHPMFGHGARSLSGQKMVVVPVLDLVRELSLAKRLFPEGDIVPATVAEHDSAMAIVLSLTHFVNLAFASTLSKMNLERLRRLGGKSFNMQLILTQAILHDDPEFLAYLQTENRYVPRYVKMFTKEVEELEGMVADRDGGKLAASIKRLKAKMEKDQSYPHAYWKMYEIIDLIDI